jgi:peptide/nickel transport system permease protein
MTEQSVDDVRAPRRRVPLGNVFRSFGLLRESRIAMVGTGIILFWVIVAILAPVLAPYPPNQQIGPMVNAPPMTWAATASGGTCSPG